MPEQVYGKDHLKKIAFDYYLTNPILHGFKFVVMFNPVFSIPFNIINTVEIFEKVKPLSFLVRSPDMSLSPRRIYFTRTCLLLCLFLLTLITTNISIVLDFVGSVFAPIAGLFIPVSVIVTRDSTVPQLPAATADLREYGPTSA